MRISDWSSDVCSSDLLKECGSTLFRWDWRWTLALRPARLQVSRRRNKAMSGGWLVEIVVLAMIAGFLALRLVSVLGRRTGHEQPHTLPLYWSASAGMSRPPGGAETQGPATLVPDSNITRQ